MDPQIQGKVVRPLSAGGGITETATVALLLTGTEEKTKGGETQPQPMLAKASYHRTGAGSTGRRASQEEGGQAGVSGFHIKASGIWMGRLQVRRTGCGDGSDTSRASPPAPALTRAILGQ